MKKFPVLDQKCRRKIKESFFKVKLHFVIWHRKLRVNQLPACESISGSHDLPIISSNDNVLKQRKTLEITKGYHFTNLTTFFNVGFLVVCIHTENLF